MAPAGFPTLNAITVDSESGGNPHAVSSMGARGLMQVLPSTARDPGFGVRPSNGTAADDVRMGEQYLAAMHNRYGGDLAKMWAAYQSGPGTVDKLAAQYGRDWWKHLGPDGLSYVNKNLGQVSAKLPAATPASPPPILSQAEKQFPFVAKHNPVVIVTPRKDGNNLLETWQPGDEGTPDRPRPKGIPMNRTGIQIFQPGKVSASDVAADVLHVDPVARQTADKLAASFSPGQWAALERGSGDYAESLGEGEAKARDNAIYAALRGYTVGQWPGIAKELRFTPDQLAMLDRLKNYMTGVH